MEPALQTVALQAAIGLGIAAATSWFTVKLSLAKFRKERLWEKKALAYERVIDAIHKAKKFSSEHLDAQYDGRDLPDERDEELRKLAKEAMDEIRRAADIGGFVLSAQALEIIREYERRGGDTKHIESPD
jgi:high-affinity Fe2+/Pb2+ permease